jgi:catechol 2,3-dioxygenase-like lactoylglutathione lyase family enzyme
MMSRKRTLRFQRRPLGDFVGRPFQGRRRGPEGPALRRLALKACATTAVALTLLHGAPTPRTQELGTPGFHHLHLNATDPDAAVAFYTQQFPSTSRTTFAGGPALQSGNVLVLFTKVLASPPTEPPTAFWHFGWHVADSHKNAEGYRARQGVAMLPLYVSDAGQTVAINTDSFPGMLTKSQVNDAKAKGVKPNPIGGWAYLKGPDGAIVEYQGDFPRERFNHVHMWQEQPYCAEIWYDRHLNAKPSASWPRAANPRPPAAACSVPRGEPTWPSLERQGTIRAPAGGVTFDDVELNWYPRQGARPLASSRGQLMDHVGLSVADLDAWVAKLRAESVKILAEPYRLGDTRAVLIEGPSREAIELVAQSKRGNGARFP